MKNPSRRPGVISMSFLLALLAILVLIVTVWNAFAKTSQKLEAQNHSDAAANAATVEAARSMNQITLTNHLIGELNAVSALAMAYGGLEFENKEKFPLNVPAYTETYDAAVTASYFAEVPPPNAMAYNLLNVPFCNAGAAIGHAKLNLKTKLRDSFARHVAAPAVELLLQGAIALEWEILDAWDGGPLRSPSQWLKGLLELKHSCNHWLIPKLSEHSRKIVADAPGLIERAVRTHGDNGSIKCRTMRFELPVETEEDYIRVKKHGWEHSQMVRATTPHVQYWRRPVLAFAEKSLPISGFAGLYLKWTQHFTLKLSEWQSRDYGTWLHILKDHTRTPGEETWANPRGSGRADELFALGLTAEDARNLNWGGSLIPNRSPNGTVALTQAMIFNDTLTPKRTDPWQRGFGTDTLNWHHQDEIPEFAYGGERHRKPLDPPRFELHWNARITPLTRWPEPGTVPMLDTLEPPLWLRNLH